MVSETLPASDPDCPRSGGWSHEQYKQLQREESRSMATYSSPYRFVDDAVDEDVSSKVRRPPARGCHEHRLCRGAWGVRRASHSVGLDTDIL